MRAILIVGPLNLLSFRNLLLESGIEFKTSEHLLLEGLVLTVMAIIVIGRYLCNQTTIDILFRLNIQKNSILYLPHHDTSSDCLSSVLLDESQKGCLDLQIPFF
jgi:hypothetical protein